MRSRILSACLALITYTAYSQTSDRVLSVPVLRDGSGKLIVTNKSPFTTADTNRVFRLNHTYTSTALGGSPSALRFGEVEAQCDPNSVMMNWVAVQQFSADKYEIEQSSDDGFNWTNVAIVPAKKTEFGEATYNYTHYKKLDNVVFRIAAVNIAGEKVYSPVLRTPCNNNNTLSLTQNPVYSTTSVRIGAPSTSKLKLVLVNNSGVIVQVREATVNQGINNIPLDMSSLPVGYYTLSIVWSGGKQDELKVIKQ